MGRKKQHVSLDGTWVSLKANWSIKCISWNTACPSLQESLATKRRFLWCAQSELHQNLLYITSCVLTSINKITWCKHFPLVTWLTPSLFFNCSCQCGNHGNGRLKPVCDIGLILQSQAGFRCDGKHFGLLSFFSKQGREPLEGRLTCWASTYLSVVFGKSCAYDGRVCSVWHLSTQLSTPPPSRMA